MHKSSSPKTVGIFGATGYAGMELVRILSAHAGVRLTYVSGDRWAGRKLGDVLSESGDAAELVVRDRASADDRPACDVFFLATPAEASRALAPSLLKGGAKVVDLSGAFRLRDDALTTKHYGEAVPSTPSPAIFGLPELQREAIRPATFISNPGCYPTAVILALAPLVEAGLLQAPLYVSAASGVTGAGRKASEEYSFAEVDDDVRAYKVLCHQHAPEIIQALGGVDLTFTAHLLPVRRGILATSFAATRSGVTREDLHHALMHRYAREPFVTVAASPEAVSLSRVVGTNRVLIGATCDPSTGKAVVVSAIDNLIKGAAGQAVQNMNLMLGFDERTGLDHLRSFRP